jgi:alanyl-tRNA synthetase
MTSLNDVRREFLDYFGDQGHTIVPSSPLVPRNDPTLMFTNAGMVQFKNVFTGAEKRPYSRATTAQKCVRAGGKHNDLDNVGYTARHHTFFEMLGNFSFGDYFKETAIELAWNLITKNFGLDVDKLLVTIHTQDDEAHALWKKIAGISDHKIIRLEENFWRMADTGPCGPCSEIFIDQGPSLAGGPPGSPDEDGDRFLEFWNLVFMQYEQVDADTRLSLPKPSIDTGMGLERIGAILQGKTDNYDTNLMRSLIEASADLTKVSADGAHAVSHRVIADHLRSAVFLIADGVLPSNEGRGYVLRRIMRRAMRHAHILGAKDPLMWRLVPALIGQMGPTYAELIRAQALATETLRLEETRFRQTLDRGLKLLDEATEVLPPGGTLAGETAFKLYDTYGFPFDLTEDALRARGLKVDGAGFQTAMAKQKADARAAWAGSGERATETLWFEIRDKVGVGEFLGYETESAEGVITCLVVDGVEVQEASAGTKVRILLNQTPFYAESGGQVGDEGVMFNPSGAEVRVSDVQKKLGELFVHEAEVTRGSIKIGDAMELRVDSERRARIRANHSATHLMHEALRRALGDHVTQKGSLVAADRLRFDFAHPKAMSGQEIAKVEADVNAVIRRNSAVVTRLMTPDAAIAAGAMALFGEKYGDEVRVLSMGDEDDGQTDRPFSVELCGGTHARRTGDIALFKIVSEGAVASGVRRIEALTGEAARQYLTERDHALADAADTLKTTPDQVTARVAALVEDRKRLERELTEARKKLALGGGGGESSLREVHGIRVDARVLDGVSAKDLRGMIEETRTKLGSGVVIFVAREDDKASIAIGVTPDLTARINAVDLVRLGAAALGGKGGGGRPDMAQAGGPDGAQAEAALEAVIAGIGA